ncbi:Zinc finger CCCH domain-containing protein 55 [Linum perenne]
MDPYETTNLLLSKIKSIDPDNASKIMGYILIHDLGERDLAKLALGHETLLLSVISKAKSQLGLSSNTLSATPAKPTSPLLHPISSPFGNCVSNNPFPHSPSPRQSSGGFLADFARNPSPHSWPVSGGIITSPNSGHFGNVSGGDCSSSSNGADALDDYPFDEYLSFLDDSRNDEFVDPGVQLEGFSDLESDAGLHRRRFSESDAEDGGFGNGYRPSSLNSRVLVGSPREIESFYLKQREGMMRLKAVHQQQQQRLVYNKYMNYLLQQNDPQRLGVAAGADDFHKYGRFCPERNEIFAMSMAEKANSAARQIYLTFPADSTFKDEDVSNYFSTFGPVEDVRIPYQQKRMFGFVTFLHAETVKLILARGNPHFICDSRVLVKPYKEKGKALNDRRQQHHMHHQLMDRGNFSPCSSPSGLDGRELYDLPIGPRMPYNSQEVMMRRKLEEQAELQQAIELQGRRLVNLQLPDLRGDYMQHHQMPTYSPHNQNTGKSAFESEPITAVENSAVDATAKQNSQTDVEPPCHIIDKEEDTNPDSTDMTNCHESSFEHGVHDASSHTNPSENQDLDGPIASTEMAGSSSLEDNDAPVPSTSL